MLISFLLFLFSSPSSSVDFLFNGFDPANITLFGNASLQSCILSLTSDAFHSNGVAFVNYNINDGHNYQVWIDYQNSIVNVTMTLVGLPRPVRPLILVPVNRSPVLLDEMYVGFCAATGQLVQSHRVLAWSFNNSNFSAH